MIRYFLESAVIWFVLFAVYQLWLQKETFFRMNRYYLLLSLLAGLVFPLIHLPVYSVGGVTNYNLPLVNIVQEANAAPLSVNTGSADNIMIARILFGAYSLVAGYLFFRLIGNIRSIYSVYLEGEKLPEKFHTVITMENQGVPFSFFRWVFIPAGIRNKPEYSPVMAHELAHIRQGHSFDILLLEILRVFFWFNPLIRLYKNALVQTHEYLADKESLQHAEVYTYGNMLLSFNRSGVNALVGNHINNSIIKKRLAMMYQKRSVSINKWKYLMVLPLFSLFFVFFSCDKQDSMNNDKNNNTEVVQQDVPVNNTADEVFEQVEEMPVFAGCEGVNGDREEIQKCSTQKMLEFFYSNLKYPAEAKKDGTQGMVISSFVVMENGRIGNIEIVKDIGAGCGDAVRLALEQMNENNVKWTPGKQNGKVVKVKYTLPVKFKLEDKK